MNFTSYFKYTTMSLFRHEFVYILLYEYLNTQNIQRKSKVSAYKQTHFIPASILFKAAFTPDSFSPVESH